jgi:hypothetical protein
MIAHQQLGSIMQRITNLSLAALRVAERAQAIDLGAGESGVKVWGGDRAVILCGVAGPLRFTSPAHLSRFVRRYRPDLAVTSI